MNVFAGFFLFYMELFLILPRLYSFNLYFPFNLQYYSIFHLCVTQIGLLFSVLGSKEETWSWGEAYEADKSSGRIHKDVRSMLCEVHNVFFTIRLYIAAWYDISFPSLTIHVCFGGNVFPGVQGTHIIHQMEVLASLPVLLAILTLCCIYVPYCSFFFLLLVCKKNL